ncbi:MAG TPA: tRNA (N6-threonylcarbamoyladenosine(37)-N6)-methyltransferase TrmO [Rhodanobacter sp.]
MTDTHDLPDTFCSRPIAFVRSPYARRIDAPHQSTVVAGTETEAAVVAMIEFVPGIPATAYRDLAGIERIWLLFAFHRSEGWKAEVRPPRGGGKRSVLATRSPHRPNAIGLSAVELVAVGDGNLQVRGVDLLDGTPILDIKPYVPYADAFPDSRAGWIDAIDAAQGPRSAPGPRKPRSARPRGTTAQPGPGQADRDP